ncbi:MAG: DUF1127 domain-containing protein [Hyphomicrobiales bacterium]|nr:DUF1127 domain-containing protein [Hyphomicrobiales bacterium]MBV8441468.1 DUF1127 domain-containing protein [Hyphomicrobiales bacterium]
MFWLIRQLARRELAEWRRLASIKALTKLSDHQLADIGLRRDQLFMLELQEPDGVRERPVPAPVFRPGFEPCG